MLFERVDLKMVLFCPHPDLLGIHSSVLCVMTGRQGCFWHLMFGAQRMHLINLHAQNYPQIKERASDFVSSAKNQNPWCEQNHPHQVFPKGLRLIHQHLGWRFVEIN